MIFVLGENMRFDILKQDTMYFADHFPASNYDALSIESAVKSPEELDMYFDKLWESNSIVSGNFWEALAWVRTDDYIEYEGFKAFSRNEHDTEYTYDSIKFQDWVLDERENFCILRHASAIYNLPIRIVEKIGMFSIDKDRQAQHVIKYIHDYITKEQKA